MRAWLSQWLARKWRATPQQELLNAYGITFSTLHGQIVLQDLLDRVYCQVYEGTDPQGAVIQNAKRAVVHDLLYNIELSSPRARDAVPIITEDEYGRQRRTTESDPESRAASQ